MISKYASAVFYTWEKWEKYKCLPKFLVISVRSVWLTLEARTPRTQVPETFLSIYILSRMTSTRAKSPEKWHGVDKTPFIRPNFKRKYGRVQKFNIDYGISGQQQSNYVRRVDRFSGLYVQQKELIKDSNTDVLTIVMAGAIRPMQCLCARIMS